ncbi:lysosome membrane protein 2-like [Pectinophora gossypiella]|uniref:lysosome membrane protein 2-like n=1 Tax=Pectinophora gossypiella TaxID=13191 RepID=UPI00214E4B02|nr:lysosome membrane protein 2-like [Pectinophora gossypiella]
MVIKEKVSLKKEKKRRYRISTKKTWISFFLGILWFSLFLFVLIADPILLMLKEYTRVTNGSFVHEVMLREMEGIHLSAYVFNVTNTERFMAGEDHTLKVQEVGPFTYREIRSNKDIEIDTEAQILRYTPQVRLEFIPEESIGRPQDINVTAPNIPMLGMTSNMAGAPWTRIPFNLLSTQLNSKAMVSMDAHNYLWGYQDTIVSLGYTITSVDFDKMGILDRLYDSYTKKPNRIEASIADEEKFMIKTVNGFKKLAMGDSVNPDECELCNTFENAFEGVGYPMGITSDFPIRIFKNGLCRILDLEYEHTRLTDYGAEALVYNFSDNFFTLDPSEPSNGVLLLPDCFFGMPLAFSKPHFLDADPSVYERIEGMKPDDRHRGWVTVDGKLGLTLETVFSLQINLVIGDVSANTEAASFSNMILPICYLRIEQPPLPDESIFFLNGMYVTGPYIILALQIVFFILAVVAWGYFGRAVYLNFIAKDNKAMSFPGTTIKEINANNVEDPLMTETQKTDSLRS